MYKMNNSCTNRIDTCIGVLSWPLLSPTDFIAVCSHCFPIFCAPCAREEDPLHRNGSDDPSRNGLTLHSRLVFQNLLPIGCTRRGPTAMGYDAMPATSREIKGTIQACILAAVWLSERDRFQCTRVRYVGQC